MQRNTLTRTAKREYNRNGKSKIRKDYRIHPDQIESIYQLVDRGLYLSQTHVIEAAIDMLVNKWKV